MRLLALVSPVSLHQALDDRDEVRESGCLHARPLSGIIQESYGDDLIEMRMSGKSFNLVCPHRPALEGERVARRVAQPVKVTMPGGREITLGRHVVAYAVGHDGGKEPLHKSGSGHFVLAVLSVSHGEHSGVACNMADVMQQRANDDGVLSAASLGKSGTLQHVFGDRHVLAKVRDSRHVFEDGSQAIDDGMAHQTDARDVVCIIASCVERSPSMSA